MQTAEYAERLEFAKDVAAQAQTNGSMNGAVVAQAPGNAPSEQPAGEATEKVRRSRSRVRPPYDWRHRLTTTGIITRTGSTPVAPATGAAWRSRWAINVVAAGRDRGRRHPHRLAGAAGRRRAPAVGRRGDRDRPGGRATRRAWRRRRRAPTASSAARCWVRSRTASLLVDRRGADRGRGAGSVRVDPPDVAGVGRAGGRPGRPRRQPRRDLGPGVPASARDLNLEGVLRHSAADALSSLGVVVAGDPRAGRRVGRGGPDRQPRDRGADRRRLVAAAEGAGRRAARGRAGGHRRVGGRGARWPRSPTWSRCTTCTCGR